VYTPPDDLLDSGILLEMAYTQKKAERVITGLEKPVNDHLLKLWTISDSFDRGLWIDNLVNWIDEIGEIVLRPHGARPPHIFYYKLLFFEPFGGGARSNRPYSCAERDRGSGVERGAGWLSCRGDYRSRRASGQFISIGGYSWKTLAPVTRTCWVNVRLGTASPFNIRSASGNTS
jgi:hypothetical protein